MYHIPFSSPPPLSPVPLVLSPGLLYVDTVVLGLLLCLYIHTCNVL